MIQIIDWFRGWGVDPIWTLLLFVVIAVFGVGRLARLITYDDFPPSVWWRIQWAKLTNDGPWAKLFSCYWCLTPWLMLIAIIIFLLAWEVLWLALIWVGVLGWLGISYVTSILVNHDERD